MSEHTRQLLHDAAPPVFPGADFDDLWRRAGRQRRLLRAGQVVASIALIAVARLALQIGGFDSAPMLGDRVEVEPLDEPVSAPLSEWQLEDRPFQRRGPVLTTTASGVQLSLFAAEGGRWCLVGQSTNDPDVVDSLATPEEAVAERLLCHELRPPATWPDDESIGSVGAIRVGEHTVYWGSTPLTEDPTPLRARLATGDPISSAGGTGGGVPFWLWAIETGGRTPIEIEALTEHDSEVIATTTDIPEPRPAEVEP